MSVIVIIKFFKTSMTKSKNMGGFVVQWLSLLHNFIQLSLNWSPVQVQTLLAACQRSPFVGQPYHKNNSSPSSSSTTAALTIYSPRNSHRQSAIAEGFAEANSVFIVYKNYIYFLLFHSKIYIQFTIFDTYFSTKLSLTNKRHYLHVLEKCLYVLQEIRSTINFRQFGHPLFLRSRDNGTSFPFTSYIIVSAKFCDITFLNNLSSAGAKEK